MYYEKSIVKILEFEIRELKLRKFGCIREFGISGNDPVWEMSIQKNRLREMVYLGKWHSRKGNLINYEAVCNKSEIIDLLIARKVNHLKVEVEGNVHKG
ncbi:unnamed protein product [Rhizophagus irregularis]|nr:unnamed protein product [Rhizophagus irregularis]